jgi:predicted ribosomally synthesized peptide with SipW-like signal peptide
MAASLVTLLGAGALGGTLAYLTDNENTVNTFTVGKVKIDGIEPSYPGNDSDDVKDLVPNEEIAKDPQLKNTGVNDAIAFIKVTVPVEDVTLVADDGTKSAKAPQEIFWLKMNADEISTHANHFASDWIELTEEEGYYNTGGDKVSAYSAPGTRTYIFGYNKKVQGSSTTDGSAQTADNLKTSALFEKVQLKNVLEGELAEGAARNLVVDFYAIQADEVLENSVDLSDTLDKTNLTKIYEIFVKQNDGLGQSVAPQNHSTIDADSNGLDLKGE